MPEQNGVVYTEGLVAMHHATGKAAVLLDADKTFDIVINNVLVASYSSAGLAVGGTVTGRFIPAFIGKVGATAGWAAPSAHAGFTNSSVVGLPASQTASTYVIPITGLKVGDTIVSYSLVGQIESAGGAVTLDADMRKLTMVAGDITDASIAAITQISVTADALINAANSSKTLATPEVIAADEAIYIKLTATTAASTDIQLAGVLLNHSIAAIP